MPSVSLTLCPKSSCDVAPLSLAVCLHATIGPPKSEHWNDGCHKWGIPPLTLRDRSVREGRRTKRFIQNFPSGHVYKVHGHTHIWAWDPAPRALTVRMCKCFIAESWKTAISRRLLLLSIWGILSLSYLTESTQSRLLHSSARHTSFRTRPCSSLLPKQQLPSLQCSSGPIVAVVATSSL